MAQKRKPKRESKPMGRPPIDPALRLSRNLIVRLTQAEYDILEQRAKSLETQVSTYVRARILAD